MNLQIRGEAVAGTADWFLQKGLAHIPEDRNSMGLVGSMSIRENLILGYQSNPEFFTNGFFAQASHCRMVRRVAKGIFHQGTGHASESRLSLRRQCPESHHCQSPFAEAGCAHCCPPTRGVDADASE